MRVNAGRIAQAGRAEGDPLVASDDSDDGSWIDAMAVRELRLVSQQCHRLGIDPASRLQHLPTAHHTESFPLPLR